MEEAVRNLRPAEAARLLGVSYPTLKQWIYRKRIRSVRTPGGHHRIPRREIARLSMGAQAAELVPGEAVEINAISGRNKLLGTVTRIKLEGLLAEVTLDIGGQELTSIITRGAVRTLGLRRGSRAYALIKATEVMMIRA
jgi:molybdopterin-binding protein